MVDLRWMADGSDRSLRAALDRVAPALSGLPITRHHWDTSSNPEWFSATATIDGCFVVKFCWSEPTAVRLWREGCIIHTLGRQGGTLKLPELVAHSDDPVLVITRLIEGRPLEYEQAGRLSAEETGKVGDELAAFLAHLHDADVLAAIESNSGAPLVAPEPQATTDRIRSQLAPRLDQHRAERVVAWCDWADRVFTVPAAQRDVLVHGDLHGHNQIWASDEWALQAVVDFETSGPADLAFDFRYLPAQSPTLDLLQATTEAYERKTGVAVDLARVMAWNVRTVLGDALWRTEAGVALPGGGTPSQWVDELGARLYTLGLAQ